MTAGSSNTRAVKPRWLSALSRLVAVAAIVGGLGLIHPSDATAAPKIGVAAAIANQVTGNVGGTTRPLTSGNEVFQDETIRTGDKANAQLLFVDETSLSVGPNSEVRLDRFVYDPTRRSGNVVLETGKGVFRFVSGNADPRSYQVKTPVATIGFRGSVVDFGYINGVAFALNVECCAYIQTPKGIQELGPGQAVIFRRDGSWEVVNFADFLIQVGGGTPYPLFGYVFVNDPNLLDFADRAQQMRDEANSHNTPCGIECYLDLVGRKNY